MKSKIAAVVVVVLVTGCDYIPRRHVEPEPYDATAGIIMPEYTCALGAKRCQEDLRGIELCTGTAWHQGLRPRCLPNEECLDDSDQVACVPSD